MNKAPQSDGTKLFSDSSTGTKSADTNDKKETSSDKKDNAADKNTENKTVAAGSGGGGFEEAARLARPKRRGNRNAATV